MNVLSTLDPKQVAKPSTLSRTAKWQVLAGAMLVQLILGTVYGYSVFWQPLIKTIWGESPTAASAVVEGVTATVAATGVVEAAAAENATRQSQLKYAFSICVLSFAISMIFAGRLQDVRGPRFTTVLGGVIIGVGFLLAALVVPRSPVANSNNSTIYLLWLTIGLLAGVGIGFAYVCPIAALVKWFPAHKGLVSGIAVAGFGFGAFIFAQKDSWVGAVSFIESYGIRSFFLTHAGISFFVVFMGGLMLRNPPAAPQTADASKLISTSDATWQELLRSWRFYIVWLMFFSGSLAGLMVIGILKDFAGNQLVGAAEASGAIMTDQLRSELILNGATAVGVLAIFNALGRVVWGIVSDRIGRTPSMLLMFILQGMTMFALVALRTEMTLSIGAGLVGFFYGGIFALFPSLTADMFGAKNLGANYGWVFTSYGIAGVIGVFVGNLAHRQTGSYFTAFAIAGVLCFLSAVLALVLHAGQSRKPKTC